MTDSQPTPPPSTPYVPAGAAVGKSPILSILALVGGIIGLLLSFFGWGFLFDAAAIVLGILARRKEPASKGMWLTGIILGIVGVVFCIGWLIFWIVIGIAAANAPSYNG